MKEKLDKYIADNLEKEIKKETKEIEKLKDKTKNKGGKK